MNPVLQHREWLIQLGACKQSLSPFKNRQIVGGFPARVGRVDAACGFARSRPHRRHHVDGEHGEEDAGEVIQFWRASNYWHRREQASIQRGT